MDSGLWSLKSEPGAVSSVLILELGGGPTLWSGLPLCMVGKSGFVLSWEMVPAYSRKQPF